MVIEPGIGLALFYSLNRFEEAEHMAQHALEMQPGYLFGLWEQGMALCGLGQGIQAFERAVVMARTPLFVGLLGPAYGRAVRAADSARLLQALEDRKAQGEYVPRKSFFPIYVGQGNVSAIRKALSVRCLIGRMRPSILRTTSWS